MEALPVGLNIPGRTLVIVPGLFPGFVAFPASGNDAEGGHWLVGIHVSLPPGRPGSQGIQLVVIVRAQYPVGEEAPPNLAIEPLVVLPGRGSALVVPGGTLNILPGGSALVLLFPGMVFVAFPIGLNMLVFPGIPVLLPEEGSAVPRRPGRPVCPFVTPPVLLPGGSKVPAGADEFPMTGCPVFGVQL